MRRNRCLEAALYELENAGVHAEQLRGGKHLKLTWHNGHSARLYVLALTPSDRSTQHIVRADVRRMLREDGALKPKQSTIVTLDCGLSNTTQRRNGANND